MTLMPDRHWILNPVEHRKTANADRDKWLEGLSEADRAHVFVSDPPDDLFVCDMCNEQMPTHDPYGLPMMVFVTGSYALCGECAKPHIEEHGYPTVACQCPGCKTDPMKRR